LGQAAFNSFNYYGGTNGYFDGDRLREIGTLGGSYTEITALNNQGVVVGSSDDGAERSNVPGFTWTAAGAMRAFPAPRWPARKPSTTSTTFLVGRQRQADQPGHAGWQPGVRHAHQCGAVAVMLSGPFQFRSEQVTGVSREGQPARVSGAGRFKGRAGYRLTLEAQDGGSQDGATDRQRTRTGGKATTAQCRGRYYRCYTGASLAAVAISPEHYVKRIYLERT